MLKVLKVLIVLIVSQHLTTNYSLLVVVVAEARELAVVIAPIVINLDEELQEDLLTKERLDIGTSLLSYLLQALTLMTDNDALL